MRRAREMERERERSHGRGFGGRVLCFVDRMRTIRMLIHTCKPVLDPGVALHLNGAINFEFLAFNSPNNTDSSFFTDYLIGCTHGLP